MALTVVLVVGVWLCSASFADAAPKGPAQDAFSQLAQRYAPYVLLQHQDQPCGAGEPFAPLAVEQILGQPDVELLDKSGTVIVKGPSADDLAAAPAGSNLNLPGDAGNPGCHYEQRFGRRTSTVPVTQYAHLAVDPDRPGKFAIQYWWWYVYNDWNDLHEGDWEMSQIVFDAATPDAAVAASTVPQVMAVSQHTGNEDRLWSAVAKDGDRPLVYSAAGSHAGYYTSALWLGTNGQTGFGCDDTRGPSDRVDPQVVVLPQSVTAGDGFGWLQFKGSWGQRQFAVNDSETGPQTTQQWQHPITWMEQSGRSAAVRVPGAGILSSAFCSSSSGGSTVFNTVLNKPWLLAATVALLIVLLVVMVRSTTWTPSTPTPLVSERAAGQILRSAWTRLRVDARRYLPIAALILAAGVITALLQSVLISLSPLDTALAVAGQGTPIGHILAVVIGFIITVPVAVIAVAWTINITEDEAEGVARRPPLRGIWRRGILVPSVILTATVLAGWVVLPIGLFLVARWFIAPAVAASTGAGPGTALRTSTKLTRRHRIRTLVIAAVSFTLIVFSCLILGTVVQIATNSSFALVNLVAGAVGAVLLPWLGIVVAMTYGDLQARHDDRPTSGAASERAARAD